MFILGKRLVSYVLLVIIIATGYVTTPNNSSVFVWEYSALTDTEISEYNSFGDSIYIGNTRVSSASSKYNCHSYAWYSQNIGTNNWWMPYADEYYDDYSYQEITDISNVQVGDRIIYLNSNGKNVHSGIVISLIGTTPNGICGYANCVVVQSKWGALGLYNHIGDLCPYTAFYNSAYPEAVSVKFYRLSNHSHVYSYIDFDDDNYHYKTCSCSTIIVPHTYTLVYAKSNISQNNVKYFPMYECVQCGHILIR